MARGRSTWGWAGAVAMVIGAGSAVAAGGCGATLPPDELAQSVRGYFAERGITLDAASCASSLRREPGQTAQCEAVVEGEAVAVEAVVTADEGLVLRPRHTTIVTARVEPEIADTLRGQGYAVTEVRCEGQVWVARPHAEHHCQVRVRGGRRYAWRGVFSGEGARHRMHLQPLPTEDAAAGVGDAGGGP